MISSDTRRRLERYDNRERELTEKYGRVRWAAWHGRGGDSSIIESAEALHALPKELDYYRTLKAAAAEAAGPAEKREVELRLSEALYNRVTRDPRVAGESARAAAEHDAFRYSFDRSELTKDQMMCYWQLMSERDPRLSKIIYVSYLQQSAALQGIILRMVDTVNNISRAAGSELGLNVRSFADVILIRNGFSEPQFLGSLGGRSISKARTSIPEIIEDHYRTKLTVLNDVMLISRFIEEFCFMKIFPQTMNGAGAYLKHILKISGFDDEFVSQLGAPPYSLDLALDEFAEANEGALWLGKGTGDYLAGVNPALHRNPRQYLQALFHECGHLIHYRSMDRLAKPAFFKNDTEAFKEAMAIYVERMISEPYALAELHDFRGEVLDFLNSLSLFLDLARARESIVRGLLEFDLYRGADRAFHTGEDIEIDIPAHYGWLLRTFSVSAPLRGMSLRFQGQSWAAERELVRPGASMEYGLAFTFMDNMELLLTYGPFSHGDIAAVLQKFCYTGLEPPPAEKMKSIKDISMPNPRAGW